MRHRALITFQRGFILLLLTLGVAACGSSSSTSATPSGTVSGASTTTSAPAAATVIAHPPTPLPVLTPSANALGITVTMADNGRSILLKQGQIIFFAFDDVQYDRWVITSNNTTILSQETAPLPPHTQDAYRANAPGEATITAKGDLICAKGTPPCLIQPRDILIQVMVK